MTECLTFTGPDPLASGQGWLTPREYTIHKFGTSVPFANLYAIEHEGRQTGFEFLRIAPSDVERIHAHFLFAGSPTPDLLTPAEAVDPFALNDVGVLRPSRLAVAHDWPEIGGLVATNDVVYVAATLYLEVGPRMRRRDPQLASTVLSTGISTVSKALDESDDIAVLAGALVNTPGGGIRRNEAALFASLSSGVANA